MVEQLGVLLKEIASFGKDTSGPMLVWVVEAIEVQLAVIKLCVARTFLKQ